MQLQAVMNKSAMEELVIKGGVAGRPDKMDAFEKQHISQLIRLLDHIIPILSLCVCHLSSHPTHSQHNVSPQYFPPSQANSDRGQPPRPDRQGKASRRSRSLDRLKATRTDDGRSSSSRVVTVVSARSSQRSSTSTTPAFTSQRDRETAAMRPSKKSRQHILVPRAT